MLYEPTAWYSYFQLSQVFDNLSDLKQYEKILLQIELWKARGRVPAAIHATYLLLNVIHCDQKSDLYPSTIRDLYAMSIIRTVNLLLDQEQDSMYAKSLLLIGKEAKLPESIIRCRHKCSHGDPPDLETLRFICKEALNYLYKKYWEKQCQLIDFGLNDEDQYSLLLFSTFLLARLGVDTTTNTSKSFYTRPKSHFYIKKDKGRAEYLELLKSIVDNSNRTINFMVNKQNLSLARRFDSFKTIISSPTRSSIELFNNTVKKLLNGCANEDLFVSIFVEFIFSNYRPSQSQMFSLFLFQTLSHYSFNFTIKLVSHMLNWIFDISDIFTNSQYYDGNSIIERVQLYNNFLTKSGLDNQEHFNSKESLSHTHSDHYYKRNVNEWLLTLIEYGISLKNKDLNKYHTKYLKLIKDLSRYDQNKMVDYELTALSRILTATSLLLPLFLPKVSQIMDLKDSEDYWSLDKVSYILSLKNWLDNKSKYFRFERADQEAKNKLVLESKSNLITLTLNLSKNLLPGTIWDNQLSKVSQTFPLYSGGAKTEHEKILRAGIKLRNYGLKKLCERDVIIEKAIFEMCSINKDFKCQSECIGIQRKLFRAISIIVNRNKAINNNKSVF